MANDGVPVLAVYDFRSKQEYIYRTNHMREITGASELIAGMYCKFLSVRLDGLSIRSDWREASPQPLKSFATKEGVPVCGEVVYEGGGNLLVLYRDREAFKRANREFSRILIQEAYSLSMVCAGVDWEVLDDASQEFEWNRTRVYRQFDRAKRAGGNSKPCNVLPYTQVDRSTFEPIVKKSKSIQEELTQEALVKRCAFDALPPERLKEGKFIDDLASDKGRDSLIAVLYFDGNSIGEKVKSVVNDGHRCKKGVEAIREFSVELHQTLVERTRSAMVAAIRAMPEERQRGFRIIIDHGDEITLICNAHAAPFALDAYFAALDGTGYHACGGMAICHSHDPYAMVYRIAEECCESGKKANRKSQKDAMARLRGSEAVRAARDVDASYVDFHFCRSGITGSLDQIRSAQEGAATARPYVIGQSYTAFLRVGELLASSKLKRSDLKELNRAILRGYSWYALEYERIKTKDPDVMRAIEHVCGVSSSVEANDARELTRRILFDVTSLYDVFAERFEIGSRAVANEGKGENDV